MTLPTKIAATFLLLIVFLCAGCSSNQTWLGQWPLAKVIYEDGSDYEPGSGNAVEFSETQIIEVIKDQGSRSYNYKKDGNKIILANKEGHITIWEIVKHSEKELNISTPIGLYILKR